MLTRRSNPQSHKTNALRIQLAKGPELRDQEGDFSTQPPGPATERPSGDSHLYEEPATGTLFDRVSEIAMGLSCETFTADERRAALAIRSAAAGLDRDDLVAVLADPREMLSNADALVIQINEIGLRAPSKQREAALGADEEAELRSRLARPIALGDRDASRRGTRQAWPPRRRRVLHAATAVLEFWRAYRVPFRIGFLTRRSH